MMIMPGMPSEGWKLEGQTTDRPSTALARHKGHKKTSAEGARGTKKGKKKGKKGLF